MPIILALLAAASPIIIELVKNKQTNNFTDKYPTDIPAKTLTQNLHNEFIQLLGNNPSEEQLLSFVEDNPEILDGIPQGISGSVNSALLFRFSVSQNQMPDATQFNLQKSPISQSPDYVIFINMKSSSASLFNPDGSMSDDLQLAWDESLQYIKSAEDNFDDFSWRVLKENQLDPPIKFLSPPIFEAVIVIGRRASLSKLEIEQIRKINEEDKSISIITYDTLLDSISEN